MLSLGGGSVISPGTPFGVTITPPAGYPLAVWNAVLDAVRRQEGNSNYGVRYLPSGVSEAIGRSAASYWLDVWVATFGNLPQALAKYGACGASTVEGQPCGEAYANAVLDLIPSALGGGAPFQGQASQAMAASARLPALLPTGPIKGIVILLGVTVLAFAVAGLRGKRPQEVKIVPEGIA